MLRTRTVLVAAVAALVSLLATALLLPSYADDPGPASPTQATQPGQGDQGGQGGQPGQGQPSRTADNPLTTRPWGVYLGNRDKMSVAYLNEPAGPDKDLLAKMALRPRAQWMGGWQPDSGIRALVRRHIADTQAGDPTALVQMAVFRLRPWNKTACTRKPTRAEKRSFRYWVREFAAGVGDSPVLLVVQPDAPFALCAPGGSQVYLKLMRYEVEQFAALPNATVYIEAGAADWLKDDVQRALRILVPAGVEKVRGFAFNGTHYDSTERQIRFGARVSDALAAQGIPGKTFVINTAQNGRPFEGYTYKGRNYDNARVCSSLTDTRCVTLGIPPTTDVANAAWGLSAQDAALAAAYVDAYLWFGRPWLYMQADPYVHRRALKLAATTPY